VKIQIVNPQWNNLPWIYMLPKVLEGHELALNSKAEDGFDANLYTWCNEETVKGINSLPKTGKNVVILRRYEAFSPWWQQIDWSKVDHLVFVNKALKEEIEQRLKGAVKTNLVYNPVETRKWHWADRKHGAKLAVVGMLNQKKNIPLAYSILGELPAGYELHIVGKPQDAELYYYLLNTAKKLHRRVVVYDQLPHGSLDAWLEDKNYLLSCSISEGNPNNVNEAMAKGIKPVVHAWPGAEDQYPNSCVFTTIKEALAIINPQSAYESKKYKEWVKEKFSIKNLEVIKNLLVGE